MDARTLGERLLAAGHVSRADIDQALALQDKVDAPLGALLVRLGAVSETHVYTALAEQLGIACDLDPDISAMAERTVAALQTTRRLCGLPAWRAMRALPLEPVEPRANGNAHALSLTLVTDQPLDPRLHEFAAAESADLTLGLIPPRAFDRLLAAVEAREVEVGPAARPGATLSERHLKELAEQAPVIELVNNMFASAIAEGASDIHVEPFEERFQVRLRVDGVLRDWSSFSRALFDPVVSRIKLLSGMDISERRKPQDGRQSIRLSGREMDLRVSALPGPFGESVVLRLLDKARSLPSFETLGMGGTELGQFRQMLGEQHGLVLVTGPTGSGKSTTLYKALSELNSGDRKIITIEDPIEYQLEGVNQTQVQADIGYTFASGLRAVLRQDPDVVMVGEIRDRETAQIAVQAALTGHLVLSTVHTNTALSAVMRMTDLGVERFLLGSALRGLVAQRLLRRLCTACAAPDAPPPGEAQAEWRSAQGCEACAQTGYRGRVAVYEMAIADKEFQGDVIGGASERELEARAVARGFKPMRQQAMALARSGVTSVAEVERVLGADELEMV